MLSALNRKIIGVGGFYQPLNDFANKKRTVVTLINTFVKLVYFYFFIYSLEGLLCNV